MRRAVCILLMSGAGMAHVSNGQNELARQLDGPFRWPNSKRVAVSLSFDDARASQMDAGLPLFDRYHAKVTFYVNPPKPG